MNRPQLIVAGVFIAILGLSVAIPLWQFKYDLCRDRGYSAIVCAGFAGSR